MVFKIDYWITFFNTVLSDCHGLVGGIIVRPSMRNRKPVQDVPSTLFQTWKVVY